MGRALVSSNNDNGGRVTLHVGRGVGVIAYSFCMFSGTGVLYWYSFLYVHRFDSICCCGYVLCMYIV